MARFWFPLLLLLLTASPAWAAGGCCPSGDKVPVAATHTNDLLSTGDADGRTWTASERATSCPCCPTGNDCQKDRCCGNAVAGSMVTGPPPFRVVLRATGQRLSVMISSAYSRALARDARPPIALPH